MLNRWIFCCYLSFMIAGYALASEPESGPTFTSDECFYLPQLSQEEIQRCLAQPSAILVCPEGTHLPVGFFLKGDILELCPAEASATLVIRRSFYLRLQEEQLFISLNGTDWKSWTELLTGKLALSLDASSGTPQLQVGAELYLRGGI